MGNRPIQEVLSFINGNESLKGQSKKKKEKKKKIDFKIQFSQKYFGIVSSDPKLIKNFTKQFSQKSEQTLNY